VVIIAPVILLWMRPGCRTATRAEAWEIFGVTVTALAFAWLQFGPFYAVLSPLWRRPIWLFMPIAWASARFRQEVNASMLAATFFIAWWGTAHGYGSFAVENQNAQYAVKTSLVTMAAASVLLLIVSASYNQRVRAEEDLRQSELKFRTLVEQSLVGVYIIQDNRFVYVNPRGAEIHGYTPEEILRMPTAQGLVFPEDLPLVREQLHLRLSGQTSTAHYTFRGLHKNGSVLYVEVRGMRIEYEGKPTLIGTLLDITEQKRAEEALHTLSARLLQLQDEEHRRLARELHDTTAQGLAALAMNLALLQQTDAARSERAEKILADSLALVERSVQEVRTFSYLLHPPELEAFGLRGAIREYAAGFARRSGIATAVDIPPDLGRLPGEMELALFRIVQECLGNILRHSQSVSATICLERSDHTVTLEIRDQGRGIPAARLAEINNLRGNIGVGIAGMRERLRQLKGGLDIASGPEGTTIRATVPAPETTA
jgi:PAS domain S-box-containing protein